MESFSEFLQRVDSFEVPTLGMDIDNFVPSDSVRQKVGEDNRFCPFYGDTVVFDLPDSAKRFVCDIAYTLRSVAPECFCEKLNESTFHMTLHDLSNSPDESMISEQMGQNGYNIEQKFSINPIYKQEITMKANYIINMVNTSIVLTLKPADEEEYNKLIELYQFFDDIQRLPYPFTPHITLAYYNRYGFLRNSGEVLKKVVEDYNNCVPGTIITLNTAQLFYQRFDNMNDFCTIFRITG